MNRRDFLFRVLSGAVGMALGAELDLDRLLWVPKPIITVPAMPAETWVTVDWVTQDVMRLFSNDLKIASIFDAEFDSSFLRREAAV